MEFGAPTASDLPECDAQKTNSADPHISRAVFDRNWILSNKGDDPRVAATCAVSVTAPRRFSSLEYVPTGAFLDTLVQSIVDARFCFGDPQSVGFFGVRGIPVLGVWSLASQSNGDTIASELRNTSKTSAIIPPTSDWLSATSDLNGVEVWFFVAAETRPSSRSPAYKVTSAAQ